MGQYFVLVKKAFVVCFQKLMFSIVQFIIENGKFSAFVIRERSSHVCRTRTEHVWNKLMFNYQPFIFLSSILQSTLFFHKNQFTRN